MDMSRFGRLLLLSLGLALPAMAGLHTGPQVAEGLALPVVVDLNGDGLTDLVLDKTVLLNSGSGNFVSQPLGLGGNDVAVEWLDVNGDGRVDLLARDQFMNSTAAAMRAHFLYIADASLHFTRVPVENSGGYEPFIAEVNGDGKDDLVLVKHFSEDPASGTELKVLLSNGDGTFAARTPFYIAKGPQLGTSNRLLAGDVDRDGHRDLVIRTSSHLNVLRGFGNGDFAPAEPRYLPSHPFGWWATELADVDADGNLDVLLAGQRVVRVLLGNGHGGFTRLASAKLARLHDPLYPSGIYTGGPAGYPAITPDNANQPRNFAFGEFVQKGRTEIAAGTGEGDVVILAWERNGLREVDRIQTELLAADVHAGSFLAPGSSDLYVTWNFGYPKARPVPRLLHAEPVDAAPQTGTAARRRVVTTRMPAPSFHFRVSHPCISTMNDVWSLTWEGPFGVERRADRTVEAVLDGDVLAFRLEAPGAETMATTLEAKDGTYEGEIDIDTSCGRQFAKITAKARVPSPAN